MGKYHDILGVKDGASEAEIKSAFRTKAKELHPDVNKDDPEAAAKFAEVKEAYEGLLSGKSGDRAEYEFEEVYVRSNAENKYSLRKKAATNLLLKHLKPVVKINVSLRSVYDDKTTHLKVKIYEPCARCGATGDKINGEYEVCDGCNGSGRMGNSIFVCMFCNGHGKFPLEDCSTCKGSGVYLGDVSIPFNVRSVRGDVAYALNHITSYDPRNGIRRPVELHVKLEKPDDNFEISGDDLVYTKKVHFQDILDKKEIIIKHITDKKYNIKCPDNCNSGTVLRLANMGLIKNDGTRGDLLIEVQVNIDYDRL